MIRQLVLVALGGGAGSVSRYLASVWVAKHFPHIFPLATFVVNMTGCFLIGFLIGLSARYAVFDSDLKFLLIVGFCGGYTTFSTFSAENMRLLETGNYGTLALYVITSILLGVVALWGGSFLSKVIAQ